MNIYLIASESYKLLDEEVKKIIPDSSNVIKYDLRKDSITDAIKEANYYSLTNEKKYIIIKATDLFIPSKKEDKEEKSSDNKILENYFNNPSENSVLVFTCNQYPDKRKKIYKQIAQNKGYIEIPSFNKKDLCYKCMDLLKKKGYKIDYDLANYIVDNSYVNYDILTSELEKIYVLLKPCELTINKIKNIISLSSSNKTFAYISAIISGDLTSALALTSSFEKMKIEPIVVLIMLAKEMQIYLQLKLNVDPKDIQRLYGKEDWMMKNYLINVQKFTEKDIKKIIVTLNDYDYNLKKGTLDKSIALDLLAIDLCS